MRHGPFPLGALSPGEQVSYQRITEAAEMTRRWPDAVGSHSFLKETASQPRLKEEEELNKKGHKLFLETAQGQNEAWHIWKLRVFS